MSNALQKASLWAALHSNSKGENATKSKTKLAQYITGAINKLRTIQECYKGKKESETDQDEESSSVS